MLLTPVFILVVNFITDLRAFCNPDIKPGIFSTLKFLITAYVAAAAANQPNTFIPLLLFSGLSPSPLAAFTCLLPRIPAKSFKASLVKSEIITVLGFSTVLTMVLSTASALTAVAGCVVFCLAVTVCGLTVLAAAITTESILLSNSLILSTTLEFTFVKSSIDSAKVSIC